MERQIIWAWLKYRCVWCRNPRKTKIRLVSFNNLFFPAGLVLFDNVFLPTGLVPFGNVFIPTGLVLFDIVYWCSVDTWFIYVNRLFWAMSVIDIILYTVVLERVTLLFAYLNNFLLRHIILFPFTPYFVFKNQWWANASILVCWTGHVEGLFLWATHLPYIYSEIRNVHASIIHGEDTCLYKLLKFIGTINQKHKLRDSL